MNDCLCVSLKLFKKKEYYKIKKGMCSLSISLTQNKKRKFLNLKIKKKSKEVVFRFIRFYASLGR